MTFVAFALALTLVLLASVAGAASYAGLPDPMPTHWNGHGDPDAYSPKGFFSVFGPVLVMLGLWLLMLAVTAVNIRVLYAAPAVPPQGRDSRWATASSDRTPLQRRRQADVTAQFLGWMALVCNVFITLLLLSSWWAPGNRPGPWVLWGGLVGMLVAVLVLLVRLFRQARDRDALPGESAQEASHYRAGIFYVNRDDPRLTVPKRLGIGFTINFGQPLAWVIFAALVGLPALVAVLVGIASSG